MHKKLEKSKPASIHMGFCEVIFILHKMAMLCYAMLSHFSRVQLCVTPWMAAHQAPLSWDSPGKNTGVGCHFLLQCRKVKVKSLSRVRLLATPWTAAYQAPPSMGFSRQEYWSGVPLNNTFDDKYKDM